MCADIECWEALVQTNDVNQESMSRLALAANYLSGKWLIFKDREYIDHYWALICNAMAQGKLGTTAKVSTAKDGEKHVICVYIENFLDSTHAMLVRDQLRELGISQTLSFKPDIYTICGIYAKNPWKMKATYKYPSN